MFSDLREMVNNGILNYPLSTRELVNIVKHLEKFPEDNVVDAMNNVFSFDFYDRQLIEQLSKVFHKHGFPFNKTIDFSIKIGKENKITAPFLTQFWNFLRHDELSQFLNLSEHILKNKDPWNFQVRHILDIKGRTEWRIKEFSELKFSWNATNFATIMGMSSLDGILFVLTHNPFEIHIYNENLMEFKIINLDNHIPQIYSLNLNPQLLKLPSSKRLLVLIPIYDVILLVDPKKRNLQPISFPFFNKKLHTITNQIYFEKALLKETKKQNLQNYNFIYQDLSIHELIVVLSSNENKTQVFVLDFKENIENQRYKVFTIDFNFPEELYNKISCISFVSLNFWVLQMDNSSKYSLLVDFDVLERSLKIVSLQKIIIINDSESWQIKENKALIPNYINTLFNNNQSQTIFTTKETLYNFFSDNISEVELEKRNSFFNTQVYTLDRKKDENYENYETLQSLFLSRTNQLINVRKFEQNEQIELFLEILNFERGKKSLSF